MHTSLTPTLSGTTSTASPRSLEPLWLARGAEDLVQETFVRVLLKPRWLHAEDDIGYLLRVLRNTL